MDRNRKAAFTLIELLVVIAIIAIIAAILFPVFARAREKARQTTCLSNEKQIAMGVLMYIDDHDELFPFVLDYSGNLGSGVLNINCGLANMGDNLRWPLIPGVTGQEAQFQLVTVAAPYVKSPNVWYCPTIGPDAAWEAEARLGCWKSVGGKTATMRDQGTTYSYDYNALSASSIRRGGSIVSTFMGGRSLSILQEPSRWPMLGDQPDGWGFTGNVADPPSRAAPHSGGINLAYGDGHAKYHHLERADGGHYFASHVGDGLYSDQ